MTDQRELDGLLDAFFATGSNELADRVIEAALAQIDHTSQRRPMRLPRRGDAVVTGARWPRARRFGRGRGITLFAAAALLIVGGAVAAGSGLVRLPAPVPPAPEPEPSLAVVPTPSPAGSLSPSDTPRPGALIAYIRTTEKPNKGNNCGYDSAPTCPLPRVWIVGSDGSGAHELFPDGVGRQTGVAWSPDGARLLYSEDGKLYQTDASGSGPQLADTGCAAPCSGDMSFGFGLSSDGTRLVFVRNSSDGSNAIATMDLASGRVTELTSTAPAGGMLPEWSPDGKQIVFGRAGEKDTGGPVAPTLAGVFVVDADGQNLRQVSPTTLAAQAGGWSPDGAAIVFTSADAQHQDIYSVRPDGTDLRRLTTDGMSSRATWTPDGRILFVRASGAGGGGAPAFWTMNADGTNAAELMPGAVTGNEDPMWTQGPAWQPVGGPAGVPLPWTPSAATSVGPPPPAPSPTPTPALAPGFSWTGSLHTTSGDPNGDTATLLTDGRVLLIHSCEVAAELYDPATGTFSPAGTMTAKRAGETATRLQDGRVLIVGGNNCGVADAAGIWASAELYDPATGTFSPTGAMRAPRYAHSATLLRDGRVLVAGGSTGSSPAASLPFVLASYPSAILVETSANVLASAELYDPRTGRFSPTGSMGDFRDHHTATLLADGRVLVVGGGGEGYASRTSAELYDPATGKFSRTGPMKVGRWLHTATLIRDGRVLIAGGKAPDDKTYASAEVYDPASGRFSAAGSMKAARQQHTATLLQDGRVLIAGGYEYDGARWEVLSSAELYDPTSRTSTPIGSMGEPRMGQTATLLQDGRVLIAGGLGIGNSGGFGLTSAVLYQP